MKYYLAIKRNEIMINATIWINLKNMLSDRNKMQKANYCRLPFMLKVQSGKTDSVESGLVTA